VVSGVRLVGSRCDPADRLLTGNAESSRLDASGVGAERIVRRLHPAYRDLKGGGACSDAHGYAERSREEFLSVFSA
jgi:hypothetical protein